MDNETLFKDLLGMEEKENEISGKQDVLTTASSREQSQIEELNALLLDTLPSDRQNEIKKQKIHHQRQRLRLADQSRILRAEKRSLSLSKEKIKHKLYLLGKANATGEILRGVENIKPLEMTLVDLLIACYSSFEKLDRRNVIGHRERAIMAKIKPYIDDLAKRQNIVSRGIKGV